MRNQLYDCIYVIVLLKILQPPICYAKVINDAHRIKRQISVSQVSNPRDLQQSNIDNVASRSLQHLDEESIDYREETEKNTVKEQDDKDKELGDVVRLSRDVNADLDKYTDQDERSNLYDDYEAKDVAKRGILGDPEDYEEEDDDSSNVIEDMVAVKELQQGLLDEGIAEKRRGDARVKRDQSVSETLDKSESSSNDPTKLEESKIAAKYPHSRQVSRVESSKSFNEASASNGASKIKESNEVISRSNDATKIDQATSQVVAPSKRGESNDAEYERRVEEEIQRKIDSIKEEIQRDIEMQRRINDIEENNARFEELQDQERENEERENSKKEPIEKRQTVAKRSIKRDRESEEEKRSLKELQRRSNEIGKSGTLNKRRDDIKKRTVANDDQVSGGTSSRGFFKKKRNRVRQTFLVNNDRTKEKRTANYASRPLDRIGVRPENELFITDQDLNSYLHTDNRMDRVPSAIASEDENNEGKHSPAERPNSLVSLSESSQELSPRLAKEYKEAFGGLQSEPGSALARFKRIKRVLGGSDANT